VDWVIIGVALALGGGTMIGWKRIVVTVGERIGKTHLTYAQGACAELVAMFTIFGADKLGLPVSTTHVLSSGVAGTMWANRSGIQMKTVRNIAAAWVLTLPVTMLLSALIFTPSAASTLSTPGGRESVDPELQKASQQRVLRKVE
jgi:PiT family inorganic phosphate transporter